MIRSLVNVHAPERMLTLDDLVKDWTFEQSTPWRGAWAHRTRARLMGRRAPPVHRVIRPVTQADRWILYFMYLPDGGLTAAHRFTIRRLAETDARLLIIAAVSDVGGAPPDGLTESHALILKALGGYDFSAYAIGLNQIAQLSCGADLFVLNDSVFGPFTSLDAEFASSPWDLTGYTASSLIENHVQSYAFLMRSVDQTLVRSLSPVLSPRFAYDRYKDVIFQQETRFARAASRRISVGARWFSSSDVGTDPSFFAAIPLLEAGFPFLKKSVFHRRPDIYDPDVIAGILENLDHPRP